MDPRKLTDAYYYDIYNTSDLNIGDHICALHMNENDLRICIVNYIAKGLAQNQKIIYTADASYANRICSYLKESQVNYSTALAKGQLSFLDPRPREKGTNPMQLIEALESECYKSHKEGYIALRMAGNAMDVSFIWDDLDLMLEYESLVNEKILECHNFIGFCHYDVTFYPYDFLNKILEMHPVCHIGTKGYPNQFYIPPEIRSAEDRDKKIFMHRIKKIKKKAAAEAAAARLCAKASELQQQFGEMLGHDLKEPIRTASFMNNLLSSKYKDDLNSQAHDILARIEKILNEASSRIDGIQEMLNVTKRQSKLQILNINHSIGDVIERYEEIVKELPGRFVFVAQPLKPLRVDKIHITQLLSNIFDNCIMYCKKTEDLIIEITATYIPKQGTIITIKDNGIGFKGGNSKKIFQPFRRLHFEPEYPGVGIGLSICQRIMHHYHGEITAYGKEGEGAIFTLIFPDENTTVNG